MVIKTNILIYLMKSRPNIKLKELKELNDCYICSREKSSFQIPERYQKIFFKKKEVH